MRFFNRRATRHSARGGHEGKCVIYHEKTTLQIQDNLGVKVYDGAFFNQRVGRMKVLNFGVITLKLGVFKKHLVQFKGGYKGGFRG